ncbi:hypothetical protein VKT23_008714 [Stygiomarasmius scandens]|uniref:Uncharacterized protein n=1 Tax=Marasmiellus scandens TaxID=2682957 RepID=A0ABR1JIC0_9AGAR
MTFVVVFLDSRRGIGAVHRYAGTSSTNAERKHRYSVTVDQRWRSRSSQRFTQTLLLVNLFSDKQIATTVHPRNEDTIVSAQQNVKPMRTPSMRRKGTVRRMRTVRERVVGLLLFLKTMSSRMTMPLLPPLLRLGTDV